MRFKINDYFTEEVSIPSLPPSALSMRRNLISIFFFPSKGMFDDERFERHVASVVKDFENKEYYTDKAWANVTKKEKTM